MDSRACSWGKCPCDHWSGSSQKKQLEMRIHLVVDETPRFRYECDVCQKGFHWESDLKKHTMTHSDMRTFQCPFCPKSFKSSSGLNYHQVVHSGVRPFSCGVWSMSFTRRSYLNDHIIAGHTNEDSQQCPTCNKIFKSRRGLKKHSIIHSELRPYICTICKRGFKSKDHLKRHGMVHLETEQHKCPFCDKSFKVQNYLMVHLRVHTRENLQKCSTCSKEFKTAKELRRHVFKHSKLHPFLCDQCPRKFKTQSYLSRHLKTRHVDEKHFKCTDCPRAFGTNRQLVFHNRHHTKIRNLVPNNDEANSWECEKCGAGSVREKHDLARHQKTRRCMKHREGNPIMTRELRICLTRIDE